MSLAVFVSNEPVGSSAKITLASLIKALAILTLCFSPPDKSFTLVFKYELISSLDKIFSTSFWL